MEVSSLQALLPPPAHLLGEGSNLEQLLFSRKPPLFERLRGGRVASVPDARGVLAYQCDPPPQVLKEAQVRAGLVVCSPKAGQQRPLQSRRLLSVTHRAAAGSMRDVSRLSECPPNSFTTRRCCSFTGC